MYVTSSTGSWKFRHIGTLQFNFKLNIYYIKLQIVRNG